MCVYRQFPRDARYISYAFFDINMQISLPSKELSATYSYRLKENSVDSRMAKKNFVYKHLSQNNRPQSFVTHATKNGSEHST